MAWAAVDPPPPSDSTPFVTPCLHYHEAMEALKNCKNYLYNGKQSSYNSMHLLRSAAFAFDSTVADSEPDWTALAVMGSGVSQGIRDHHIENYVDALAFRDAIAAITGTKYNLGDLVCFICLSKDV